MNYIEKKWKFCLKLNIYLASWIFCFKLFFYGDLLKVHIYNFEFEFSGVQEKWHLGSEGLFRSSINNKKVWGNKISVKEEAEVNSGIKGSLDNYNLQGQNVNTTKCREVGVWAFVKYFTVFVTWFSGVSFSSSCIRITPTPSRRSDWFAKLCFCALMIWYEQFELLALIQWFSRLPKIKTTCSNNLISVTIWPSNEATDLLFHLIY